MSKITIIFDTETKTVTADVDGTAIGNVESVYVGPRYRWDPISCTESKEPGIEICTRTEVKPGVIERRQVCASVREYGQLQEDNSVRHDIVQGMAALLGR